MEPPARGVDLSTPRTCPPSDHGKRTLPRAPVPDSAHGRVAIPVRAADISTRGAGCRLHPVGRNSQIAPPKLVNSTRTRGCQGADLQFCLPSVHRRFTADSRLASMLTG